MNPPVSAAVVIPAYNAAATIGDTLRALRAQAGASNFEVIVVDNGSSDATADVARSHGATVLFEEKRGPSAARNCGLRACNTDVVAHLDADTVPSRRWLCEILVPFLRAGTVLVAGNTLCYPPQTGAERYVQSSGLYDPVRAISRTPFPFAPSLNLAVRREATLAIGGWCEEMATGEDVDFSHRLLRAYDTEIVYCPKALVYHRTRATDAALRRQAWTYGEGAADLYLRYPDVVRWNAQKSMKLLSMLASRMSLAGLTRFGTLLGITPQTQAEFYKYHSLWTRNFWLGFFWMYRRRQRRVFA